MHTHYKKRPTELVAIGSDGTTYIIERRSKALPCDDGEQAFFYCCVQDGRPVSWLGESLYALPDGTELRAVACRLADAPPAQ